MEEKQATGKYYFASDMHLGMYPKKESREREKLIVNWLESIREDASAIFLVGDIFDFWWEYKKVIPKGFSRFFGKIAEITDSGIPVHFFPGNHDIWVKQYLADELGIIIHHQPLVTQLNESVFFIAHGDGLGKGDYGYKFLKWLFQNKILQFLFARLHPNFALTLAHTWAKNSRLSKKHKEIFAGEEHDFLLRFAREYIRQEPINYFVFGHRHVPLKKQITDQCHFVYLGDWIDHFSYGSFDGQEMQIKKFTPSESRS